MRKSAARAWHPSLDHHHGGNLTCSLVPLNASVGTWTAGSQSEAQVSQPLLRTRIELYCVIQHHRRCVPDSSSQAGHLVTFGALDRTSSSQHSTGWLRRDPFVFRNSLKFSIARF
jgi:hypothetical protein